MGTTRKQLPSQSSVRWDDDLQPLVNEWFEKNPGWTISQLANQAIRQFVQAKYSTVPIELFTIEDEDAVKLRKKVMKDHADALERLK